MNVFVVGLVLGVICWALGLLYICVRWLGLHPKKWVHAIRISWDGRIEEWVFYQAMCFMFLGQMLAIALWTFKIYPF